MERYYRDKGIEEILSFVLPLETVRYILVFTSWDKDIPEHPIHRVFMPLYFSHGQRGTVITPSLRKRGVQRGWLCLHRCLRCWDKISILFSYEYPLHTYAKRIADILRNDKRICEYCR